MHLITSKCYKRSEQWNSLEIGLLLLIFPGYLFRLASAAKISTVIDKNV